MLSTGEVARATQFVRLAVALPYDAAGACDDDDDTWLVAALEVLATQSSGWGQPELRGALATLTGEDGIGAARAAAILEAVTPLPTRTVLADAQLPGDDLVETATSSVRTVIGFLDAWQDAMRDDVSG